MSFLTFLIYLIAGLIVLYVAIELLTIACLFVSDFFFLRRLHKSKKDKLTVITKGKPNFELIVAHATPVIKFKPAKIKMLHDCCKKWIDGKVLDAQRGSVESAQCGCNPVLISETKVYFPE